MKLAIILALMISSAQAQPMQPQRVEDWIALDILFFIASPEQVKDICPPFTQACAVPVFAKRRCLVLLPQYDEMLIAHERLHCYGFDHIGDSTMRSLWESYKSKR